MRISLTIVFMPTRHIGGFHIDGQFIRNGKVQGGNGVTTRANHHRLNVFTGRVIVTAIHSPLVRSAAGSVIYLAGTHILYQEVNLADSNIT